MMLGLPGPAQGQTAAEAAYQEARQSLLDLIDDAKRKRYRDQWMRVIGALERSTERLPAGSLRCAALFNQGRAWDELSRVSILASDRREAVKRYRAVGERCPNSTLGDDALLKAAELIGTRDVSLTRSLLEELLRHYPKGDMVPRARAMLAELPKGGGAPEKAPAQAVAARQKPASAKSAPAKSAPTAAKAKPSESERIPGSQLPSAVEILAAMERGEGGEEKQAEALRKLEVQGELPLSLIAGLKVKRVVLDPGHGGKDSGAIGPGGTKEKDLTLAMAKRLKGELEAMGLEVFLTRDRDVFVPLEERTRFANEKRADLFISLHVNAAHNRKAYGIETYTLNLNSDRYASRLAARENATAQRSIGDLHLILADLTTKANTDDSIRLARLVQSGMVDTLRPKHGDAIRDLGIKQALFYVLVGAKMPAILVEAGFVSHREEEKRLRSTSYQEELVRGMAHGIRRFVSERENLAHGGDLAPTSAVF